MKKVSNLFVLIILFISVLSCDERIIPKPLDGSNTGITPVDPPTNTPKTAAELILGEWVYEEITFTSGTKNVVIYKKGGKNTKEMEVLNGISYSFQKGGILGGTDQDGNKKTGNWALSNQDKKISLNDDSSKSDYDIEKLTEKNFDYSQTIDVNNAGDDLAWVLISTLFGFPDNITTLKVSYKMVRK
jgi:hypothetical protein